MKIAGYILFVFICFNLYSCQSEKAKLKKEFIKHEAEVMANALIAKDYETYMKYIHPNFIKHFGGKEQLLSIFKRGLPNGSVIKKAEISLPSDTIRVNDEIQCTLTESIEMTVPGGIMMIKSNLIGVTQNQGENWYFIDASSQFMDKLKQIFPNLSDRLILLDEQKPTFISE